MPARGRGTARSARSARSRRQTSLLASLTPTKFTPYTCRSARLNLVMLYCNYLLRDGCDDAPSQLSSSAPPSDYPGPQSAVSADPADETSELEGVGGSVFVAQCGSPLSIWSFHMIEFTATFFFRYWYIRRVRRRPSFRGDPPTRLPSLARRPSRRLPAGRPRASGFPAPTLLAAHTPPTLTAHAPTHGYSRGHAAFCRPPRCSSRQRTRSPTSTRARFSFASSSSSRSSSRSSHACSFG